MNHNFRKRLDASRLSPEQADRQGRVSHLAFMTLGQAAAIAFLNGPDPQLGGRPLDIAMASLDGFRAVEAALLARPSGAQLK